MNVSGGMDVELDFIADAKDKRAGVLHAPFHIGQNKLSFESGGVAADLQGYGKRNRMVAAVNAKDPVDLNLRISLRQKRPGHFRWRESGIRVLLALQDVVVHSPVTPAIAALSALNIDYDRSRRRPDRRIKVNQSAFQRKASVHGVEHVRKRKFDLAIRGIQFERHLLRPQGTRTPRDPENGQQNR